MLKYRFKLILTEKVIFFWTLLFPMLLATFFNVTLKDAFNVEKITTLKVAVLQNEAYEHDLGIQALLDQIEMIEPVLVDTQAEGISLLSANEVSGFLELRDDIFLSVNNKANEGSTLSYIFDVYKKQSSMLNRMFLENPELMATSIIEDSLDLTDYFNPNVDRNNETVVVIYFYTTLAMLCVYAGQWGNKSAKYLQADDSDVAKRINIAPTSKLRLMLMDIFVVYVIYCVQFSILFAYLRWGLQIPFGNHSVIIAMTALLGGLVNILLGYSISLIFKDKSISIISFGGMFASFLAGMQFVGVKYYVQQHLPLLAYLNPANLITDNFYITFYYQDMSRAYLNLAILAVMALVIGTYSVYRMKGVSYDSL